MNDMQYQFGVTKDGKKIKAVFEGPDAGMVLIFSPDEAKKIASDLLVAAGIAAAHDGRATND